MSDALIGHSGFVGTNLARQAGFDHFYNSSNIGDIRGKKFDLIVCSGARAEKWLINRDPEPDLANIGRLIENLKAVSAKKIVLISTIDVYDRISGVDEDTTIDPERSDPYGRNRYILECFIKDNFNDHTIVRLPALFGPGLKKNFIYDMANIAPGVIMAEKFDQITAAGSVPEEETKKIVESYSKGSDGNYRLNKNINGVELKPLESIFKKINFTSLSFTHKDTEFQFYGLESLWADIRTAMNNSISLVNFATEPLCAAEAAKAFLGIGFNNITAGAPLKYNVKTKHCGLFGGTDGYLYDKSHVIGQIKEYLKTL